MLVLRVGDGRRLLYEGARFRMRRQVHRGTRRRERGDATDEFVALASSMRPKLRHYHPFGPSFVLRTFFVVAEFPRANDSGVRIAFAHMPTALSMAFAPIQVEPAEFFQPITQVHTRQPLRAAVSRICRHAVAPVALAHLFLAEALPTIVVHNQCGIDEENGFIKDVCFKPNDGFLNAPRPPCVYARISDLAMVLYRQDQSPRLDFWGSDVRSHTT